MFGYRIENAVRDRDEQHDKVTDQMIEISRKVYNIVLLRKY